MILQIRFVISSMTRSGRNKRTNFFRWLKVNTMPCDWAKGCNRFTNCLNSSTISVSAGWIITIFDSYSWEKILVDFYYKLKILIDYLKAPARLFMSGECATPEGPLLSLSLGVCPQKKVE